MIGVYAITNKANGKKYIGQSKDIMRRWAQEKDMQFRRVNAHLFNAFKKYGLDMFAFTVLCECKQTELYELEKLLISELETHKPEKGYNKTFGGEGGNSTSETREKISDALKGRAKSPETKEKLSISLRGRSFSDETLRKMSESGKKRKASAETRRRISEGLKGRVVSAETRQKIGAKTRGLIHNAQARAKISAGLKGKMLGAKHPQARPVLQYTKAGEFIREFDCSATAGRVLGSWGRNIRRAAAGKGLSACGYVWRYKGKNNGF